MPPSFSKRKTTMNYVQIKDLKISNLGMGCMRLPVKEDGTIDREKASEIIKYAYDHGINYFDVAYRYHDGEAEPFLGSVIKQFPRESFYLVSKFPGHMLDLEPDGRIAFNGFPDRKIYFDSPKALFEEQLNRLGVDYFDIYHLHNVNEKSIDMYMNDEVGIIDTLIKEKEAGRIKHLGFSAHGRADTIEKILKKYPGVFDAVQIQINYLDWVLQDAKAKYELLESYGIPIISMESVRGGALAKLPEKAANLLKEADPDVSQAQWALRWLQAKPNVKVVLSGMSTLDQLKENLATFEDPKPLDSESMKVLDGVIDTLIDRVPCTGCRYCTEGCPQGLNIPLLISYYNEAKHSGVKSVTLSNALGVMKPEELPSACIGCGACAAACPQGIQIPDIMSDFASML